MTVTTSNVIATYSRMDKLYIFLIGLLRGYFGMRGA